VLQQPASAGTEASRAEINRNSVVSAVDRALVLAQSTLIELASWHLSRQLSMTTECLLLRRRT